ncbi:pyridoxamine 5'-phosphate oxidase family protein [Streptomyces sp. CB01881]|uniref:pyridoxamine 5'-phosphate oxidase family protein n=1 Tax=Streptomyces sp. CB01881 TaxID=2078691 RepID=UPI000CDC01D2|nr:pyridoxamine 5'-phosphate oxidase family protein [Streptomyces sp. CB01881]AUY47675.1 pyridoxamine 5'-phosphate oxidase [Streptomyces sp. CB01881]TYC76150.1 pyridoxamine 5'-phosphate oxidase family protein [Streptomyces sp. CB01881]
MTSAHTPPAPVPPDHTPLDERQCLRLLAGASVGRVVYTVGALPAVLPIRYRLDDDGSVLLRSAARSELVRAVGGALVAFEAGEVDAADGSGWSVTVLGRADVTEDPPPTGAAGAAGAVKGPPAPVRVSIRIRPELVTGRFLTDPAVAPLTS